MRLRGLAPPEPIALPKLASETAATPPEPAVAAQFFRSPDDHACHPPQARIRICSRSTSDRLNGIAMAEVPAAAAKQNFETSKADKLAAQNSAVHNEDRLACPAPKRHPSVFQSTCLTHPGKATEFHKFQSGTLLHREQCVGKQSFYL